MIYLLDTNVFADFLSQKQPLDRLNQLIRQSHRVCICRPVYYEITRGLKKVASPTKLQVFTDQLLPLLEWVELLGSDWDLASQYWIMTTASGKQLSDIDLLIGAVSTRLGAIIVTADDDFDFLPVHRENWRQP